MPTRIETIQRILKAKAKPHMADLYRPEMEVQVNVHSGPDKVTVQGPNGKKRWYYCDPEDALTPRWAPYRIPFSAFDTPHYDEELAQTFPEDKIQSIGLSGWNWKQRQTEWVGYDFDSILNHHKGLKPEQLEEIKNKLQEFEYANIYTSTSGKGLHVYVFLATPEPTATHTEHKALARAILALLSIQCDIKLDLAVDSYGQILWIWHEEKQNKTSFVPIKRGRKLDVIPHNWRDHIEVAAGRAVWAGKKDRNIAEIARRITFRGMTTRHKRLVAWFIRNHHEHWWDWDYDRNMLVCHTSALKKAHVELKLEGPFETVSRGVDAMDHNCFMFPLLEGWVIRRFNKGTQEHQLWSRDSTGWTKCYYDRPADLATASRHHGGAETEKGAFVFRSLDEANKALFELGIIFDPQPEFRNRQALLRLSPDNKTTVRVVRQKGDPEWVPGWAPDGKSYWLKIIHTELVTEEESDSDIPDQSLRFLVRHGSEVGWKLCVKDRWTTVKDKTMKDYLRGMVKAKEANHMISLSISNPWELVSEPFQPEYPGGRKWNIGAPQLAIEQPEEGDHSHWDLIFNHLGETLGPAVRDNPWCQSNGIHTGGEYLRYWVACMIQKPDLRLPYLFFYSPDENTGKSSLHEFVKMLFKGGHGVVRADTALTSKFNGELANAILCTVEEVDLSKDAGAAAKIRDWTTSPHIPIRAMYTQTYDAPNFTHWIQTANYVGACPVPKTDTRIVVIRVHPVKDEIPKPLLRNMLMQEISAFTYTILNTRIADPPGRLGLPTLATPEKLNAQAANMTQTERFFASYMIECDGAQMGAKQVYNVFVNDFLQTPTEREMWTYDKFLKSCPGYIPLARYPKQGGAVFYNVTMDRTASPTEPLVFYEGAILTREAAQERAHTALKARVKQQDEIKKMKEAQELGLRYDMEDV